MFTEHYPSPVAEITDNTVLAGKLPHFPEVQRRIDATLEKVREELSRSRKAQRTRSARR